MWLGWVPVAMLAGHGGRILKGIGSGGGGSTATTTATSALLRVRPRRLFAGPTPPVVSEPTGQGPAPVRVILTHTICDFDALASAVGLSKIWTAELDGQCEVLVVLPRGAHPSVGDFLALHRHLFPVRKFKAVSDALAAGKIHIERAAMVDCQRRDRLGPGVALLDAASQVTVIDHHVDGESDVDPDELRVEEVGSVSTIVTEMLMNASIPLSDVEATLMALGIHADTGSLGYDSATPRDAECLAWLMHQGASQVAIAEYGKQPLSPSQQKAMIEAFSKLQTVQHNGMTVGFVTVPLDGYVPGMARVAQNVLDMTSLDVLLFGGTYIAKEARNAKKRQKQQQAAASAVAETAASAADEASAAEPAEHSAAAAHGPAPDHMIVVGRARPRTNPSVNLHTLMDRYGGGGHGKAAAVTLRLDRFEEGPAAVLRQMVSDVCDMHQEPATTAEDFMTAPVLTCEPEDTISKVAKTMRMRDITGLPVAHASSNELVGLITIYDIRRALVQGVKDTKPVSTIMIPKSAVITAPLNMPMRDIEQLLIHDDVGRIPILAPDGSAKILGILTRTDLLRRRGYYSSLHYHNKGFADSISDRQAWLTLRRKLKQFDVD